MINAEKFAKMTPEQIINAFSKRELTLSPATCPASIPQGSVRSVTIAKSEGTSPYTYKLYVDGVEKATYGPTANTSHVFPYTFTESAGNHTYKGYVKDSCSTPKEATDECVITITVCPALGAAITIPES